MKRAAIAILLLSCSRHHEDQTTLTSAKLDAATTQQSQLEELVKRWNGAVSQRDPTLSDQVYGSRVELYGVPLRHDQILQVQKASFDADQSFTQKLERVTVSGTRVDFTRKYVRFGKVKFEHAWIGGAQENGKWVVTSVGDDASDERMKRAANVVVPRCEDLARRVAMSTKEATALVEGPPDNVQTRVAASPPEFPAYAIVGTTMANNVPTTVAWYDVVACRLYEPSPSPNPSSGACVTPGNAPGAVTDVFTGSVLTPDPNLLVEMSQCPD